MKKQMKQWQMVVGLILCLVMATLLFVPSFQFRGDKLDNSFTSSVQDAYDDLGSEMEKKHKDELAESGYTKEDSSASGDALAQAAKDELDDIGVFDTIKEKLDKRDVSTEANKFQWLTNSPNSVLAKVLNVKESKVKSEVDKIKERADKDKESKEDSEKSDGNWLSDLVQDVLNDVIDAAANALASIIDTYYAGYNLIRGFLCALVILLILVFVFTILAGFKKISVWIPVIMAWIFGAANVAYAIVHFYVIPKRLGNYFEGILSDYFGDMLSNKPLLKYVDSWIDSYDYMEMSHKIVSKCWGSGFYLWFVVAGVFLVWSVLCLVLAESRPATVVAVDGYGNSFDWNIPGEPVYDPGGFQPQSVPQQSLKQPQLSSSMVNTGNISGVTGTLNSFMHIEIQSGEQIVIGRDPSVSELILENPKVSRKHMVLQYDAAQSRYQIFCFSVNGVILSDGRKISQNQSVSVEKGTNVIMADGQEVIHLG